MKIIEAKMAQSDEKIFVCLDTILHSEIEIGRFDEKQICELIVYLKTNRPELICPIMCEECPEHLAQVESHNQCHNMRERGK